jgi:hypothetical protein
MLFKETVGTYSIIKRINIFCGENAELMNVKAVYKYTYLCALKV